MYNYIYIQYIQYITNRAFAKIGAPKISTVQVIRRTTGPAQPRPGSGPWLKKEAQETHQWRQRHQSHVDQLRANSEQRRWLRGYAVLGGRFAGI